ncbi:MAG: EAL domain-containing protein [Candidatus Baltobacteraceae bacterium]|jgi:diguanylate cyclase (GGDEF)-like protein
MSEQAAALLVFDPLNGAMLYANAAAVELFGVGDGVPRRAGELLPQLADLSPRRFEARSATPARGECELAVRLEALRCGPLAGKDAVLASVQVVDGAAGCTSHERRAKQRGGRLEALWSLVVRRGLTGADQVRAILREAVRGMELKAAALERIVGEELVLEFAEPPDEDRLPAERRTPVERSLARGALRSSGTFAVLDVRRDPEFGESAGVRCFVSAAFRAGDASWVLTLTSDVPRPEAFDEHDWAYVEDVLEALARAVERREKDARIEHLAYSDALTALPNRVAVLTRLDEALAEADRVGSRVAVLFLDIDGFKAVNDTVGHRGGDLVLAEVAQRLRGTLRREEYMGRLGGDEFAVVLPHVAGRAEIESISQRISSVLVCPFPVGEYRFSLSASIGAAIYPDDAAARDELLACADAAMYAAKDDGGSRLRFRNGADGFAAEIVMRGAGLAAEPHDVGFLLCYQPIVEAASGRIVGAEALVRRLHPLHGLLAPERGWSIARDERGRRALDRWVLREAARQARLWLQAGTPLRIDVNLAAYNRREVDVLLADEALRSMLRSLRIEIAPARFRESGEKSRIAGFVEQCASDGFGFTLDGFDGGLGTLTSLSHWPIDAVKLDRALVEGVTQSRTARAIVEGTVVVAKSLGWQVIAKGVETAMQQEMLVSLGCDGIQGFYLAHPMTASDFGTWLRERSHGEASA